MNYLVTGCSRGVGLEICRVLLEQGHTVYGVARSYTDEFKKLESEFDNKLFFKSIDLGDSENVHRNVFKDFVNNRIQLHGYVNNAAMAYDDIVTNLKLDRLQSMYSVNVFTPMMITKYVYVICCFIIPKEVLFIFPLSQHIPAIKGWPCMHPVKVHLKLSPRIRRESGGSWEYAVMWWFPVLWKRL